MRSKTRPYKQYRVTTISEFLDLVVGVQRDFFKLKPKDVWGPWFRGHQKAHWSLLPKLCRGGYDAFGTLPGVEDEIRDEFILRAGSLTDSLPVNLGKWEWYFLMQHHAAPTRLLDWTDGALIGLYFAVKDNPGHYDAAVWMLNPFRLNELIINEDAIVAPNICSARERRKIERWLPDHAGEKRRFPKTAAAVLPTHLARRISSQRSCFTVHGFHAGGLESLARVREECLVKIVIPSTSVREIAAGLEVCGIDEATIFPDLDGLSRCITGRWKPPEERLAHKGVYTRLRPSKIDKGGVGVFAIRNIPNGQLIFAGDNEEIQWVERASFKGAPISVRKLYNDFAIIKGTRYGCPLTFNRLTLSWYINKPKRGQRPNVRCETEEAEYEFYALRNIKIGEELTVAYYDYSDEPTSSPS